LLAVVLQPSFGRGLIALSIGFGVTMLLYVAHLFTDRSGEVAVQRSAKAPRPNG
jgi:hypothetical protein